MLSQSMSTYWLYLFLKSAQLFVCDPPGLLSPHDLSLSRVFGLVQTERLNHVLHLLNAERKQARANNK